MPASLPFKPRPRPPADLAVRPERRLEHPAVEGARTFMQATLDSLPASIAVLDEHGVVLLVSGGFSMTPLGAGDALEVGDDYLALCERAVDQPRAAELVDGVREVLSGARERFELEYRATYGDRDRWFLLRAAGHRAAGPERVVLQQDDITARHRAEADARLRAELLDEVDAAVIATDATRKVTFWNRGAERLYGWSAAEALGRPFADLGIVLEGVDDERAVKEAVQRRGHWQARCDVGRKYGSKLPALLRLSALSGDGDGAPRGIVGVSVDMTEIARAESELRLTQSLSRAVTENMGEGLCAVDEAGRLIYMNSAAEEMLGWTLPEVSGRVMHLVIHGHRPDGSPLPADECPILRSRVEGATIRVEDDTFIRRDGTFLPVAYTASPFETAEGIRGSVYVFSDITERRARQEAVRREMESLAWIPRITDALADDRLLLHAQPIIDLATGETVQHELLVRMLDTEGSLVLPGRFLPAAERHGLIADIDRWVIGQGLELAAAGHPIELNVSACSLGERGLAGHVERELSRTGADPCLVCFEITETALLHNEDAARAFIARVEALGCQLALDDFGTGYGGFTYLKSFPVQFLKIDIEFVRDLPRAPASQHVVRAVVNLARGFGQKTVAEGVEDEETLHLLADLGVDFAQGYYIARPAPLARMLGRR